MRPQVTEHQADLPRGPSACHWSRTDCAGGPSNGAHHGPGARTARLPSWVTAANAWRLMTPAWSSISTEPASTGKHGIQTCANLKTINKRASLSNSFSEIHGKMHSTKGSVYIKKEKPGVRATGSPTPGGQVDMEGTEWDQFEERVHVKSIEH